MYHVMRMQSKRTEIWFDINAGYLWTYTTNTMAPAYLTYMDIPLQNMLNKQYKLVKNNSYLQIPNPYIQNTSFEPSPKTPN